MRFLPQVLVVVCSLLGAPAFAQQSSSFPTMGLDRLVLTPGNGPLIGGDAKTLGQLKFRAGLVFHYERAPLVIHTTGNGLNEFDDVISHRLQAHAFAAIGLLDWLELQLQMPVTIWQQGIGYPQFGIAQPAAFGVGSPVVGLRAGILAQGRGDVIDLAVQVSAIIPTGTAVAYTGLRSAAIPQVHVGRSFGDFHLMGMLGAAIEPTQGTSTIHLGSQFEGIVTAEYGDRLRVGLTSRNVVSFVGAAPSTEVLASVRYARVGPVDFFASGGPAFGAAPGTPAFRVLAGVAISNLTPADPCLKPDHAPHACPLLDDDHDGIVNGADQCLLEPEDLDGVQDADGCIDADDDGDAVLDADDQCPRQAGVKEYQGCPVPDADGDGLNDTDDQCPQEKGPLERNGCPLRDQDSDGIEDSADLCPAEPGITELKGCPAVDRDQDTVPDHLDRCPDEKGVVANQGCPAAKKLLVVITSQKLEIKDRVYFATGKATLLPRSFKLLDEVASVIAGHPEMHVVVEGHTDDVGSPEMNRALSEGRAQQVMAYLLKKGIGVERLSARGFGPDRPAFPNDTSEGREKNRRVEFTLPSTENKGEQP